MRSTISRPDLDDVLNYRAHVNEAISDLMGNVKGDDLQEVKARMALGINHEQQHQELLMMDIKMNYYVYPLSCINSIYSALVTSLLLILNFGISSRCLGNSLSKQNPCPS